MDRQLNKMQQWLDTAVGGIRFGPDRKEVRAELQAHLEDKTADLQRIFPDISPEEAEAWAIGEMGDAEELRSARVARDDERSQEIELRAVWKAARATQTALFLGLLAAGWLGWSDVSLTLSIVLFFYFSALAVFRAQLSKRM